MYAQKQLAEDSQYRN